MNIDKLNLALEICESTKNEFRSTYAEYKKSNNQKKTKQLFEKCKERINTFYFLIRSNDLEKLIRAKSNNPFYYEDDSDIDHFLAHLDHYVGNIKSKIENKLID